MKTVEIRKTVDGYKAAPHNYNRTKTAFGAYQFPATEFDTLLERAKAKGYEVKIVDVPERHHRARMTPDEYIQSIIVVPQPAGHIDEARGVLKTLTTEYVRDCVTTELIPIQRARFIGVSKGFPYWIRADEDLAEVDVIYPSTFGEKDPKKYPRRIAL